MRHEPPPRPDQNLVLLIRTVSRERLTEILLMIPAMATMMLTYYGISVTMSEGGAKLVQKGQALAVALSIGVFAWLGWFFLFGLIYRLKGYNLTTALSAAIVYVGTLAAIDAPFNMMAIAGGAAVQLSLDATTVSAEERKEVVFHRATVAQQMVPAMRAQAERFANLETAEVQFGTHSGRKGPGKVSQGFGQVAGLLTTLVRELEAGVAASTELQQEISAEFATLKAQTYRAGPMRARVETATIAVDRIDDLFARLGQYDYAVSIRATLDSLQTLFPAPANAGSEFEQVQNAELLLIGEMAKPVAEALRRGLDDLGGDDAAVERLRPLSPHAAVRTYWRELLPEWAAALFIDLAPAALLIILIAAWREQDRPQSPPAGPPLRDNLNDASPPSKGRSS